MIPRVLEPLPPSISLIFYYWMPHHRKGKPPHPHPKPEVKLNHRDRVVRGPW